MIVRLFVLCLFITEAASLLCYGCSSSEEDPDKNQCMKWVRTMNRYRQRYYEGKSSKSYVKDCTGFHNLTDDRIYCAIMKIELGGNIRTYIRGCSDGADFFSADYNSQVSRYTQSDNQTYCIYTGQGYVACATICQTSFCNGYVSDGGRTDVSYWLLFLLLFSVLCINFDRFYYMPV